MERGTNRAILEVEIDEGIVGIGETYGAAARTLQSLKEMVAATDPFEFEKTLQKIYKLRTIELLGEAFPDFLDPYRPEWVPALPLW